MDKKMIKREYNGILLDYLEVKELPSMFRFYDTSKLYVRGLNLLESEYLSKYLDNTKDNKGNLEELVKIYKDVIIGIDLLDLELVDFLSLITLSSTLTAESFTLAKTQIRCVNIVKNFEKDKILLEIKKLKDKFITLTDEDEINKLQNNILELENKYKNLPDESFCNTLIEQPVTIFDFNFEEPNLKEKVKIEINNTYYIIGPLFVKDYIEIEEYKNNHEINFNEKTLYLAQLIKSDKTLEEKINILLYSPIELYQKLIDYENKFNIEQKPIIKRCPRCMYENKLYFSIDKVKVYP